MTNILQEEASVFKYQSRGLFQAHNADRTQLIGDATFKLAADEVSPHDLGFFLNDTLLSAIATKQGRNYGKPKEAFRHLVENS